MLPDWRDLAPALAEPGPAGERTRERIVWSRVRHGRPDPYFGETGEEHAGAIAGVRAVVTGHTPLGLPAWTSNVLAIDTGVHVPRGA